MKIIGWTNWDSSCYDIINHRNNKIEEAIELTINELRKNNYKFTGDYHQNGDYGVPIFDNGAILKCSQREWGRIMASAYPNEIDDSDGLGYCTWAWLPPEPMSVPQRGSA